VFPHINKTDNEHIT